MRGGGPVKAKGISKTPALLYGRVVKGCFLFYHVLVHVSTRCSHCRHVVNKGCRLSPSTCYLSLAYIALTVRIHRAHLLLIRVELVCHESSTYLDIQ